MPQSGPRRRMHICALLPLLLGLAHAEEREYKFEPAVYALEGGHVIPVLGPPIEGGTVLLRDGMIEAVGASVAIPPDAVVIDCKGLNVYPGLIDARTSILQPAPASAKGDDKAPDASSPSASGGYSHEIPEVRPERRAADLLAPKDSELEKWRTAGFTSALSVPKGRIFAGQSALIDLAGDKPGDLILQPRVALHLNFEKAEGHYPGALMGVMALIRQTFLDTEHYSLELARFKLLAGQRLRRPSFNAALEALEPALRRELPVYWDAPGWLDALRALRLAHELGLQPILAGVRDAYRIVPQLQAAGACVLLSVNYPKKGDPAPSSDFQDQACMQRSGSSASTGVDSADEEADADRDSLDALRDRLHTPESAALLHKAGVRFAFTSFGLDGPADLSKNVALAIQKGLPRDAALAALTLEPARILGAESMIGSLTPGKIANVLVTEGELFDKKTKVKHLFIDGRKMPLEEKSTKGDPNAKIELAGTWDLTVESDGGKIPATLSIQGAEGSYSGSISAMGQSLELGSIEAEGNQVTLRMDGGKMGMNGEIVLDCTVTEDSLSGSISMPNGETASLQGTRTSPGPKEGSAL